MRKSISKLSFLLAFLLFSVINCAAPPLWPERFTQDFIQTDSFSQFYTPGKIWYDVPNNRQRWDVKSDYFDIICTSVSLNKNSSCSQVNVNDTLYIVLPNENKCCKCCKKQQGCDIIQRDWLKDYQFVGTKIIDWDPFNVWTHFNTPINSTYYATTYRPYIPKQVNYPFYSINFLTESFTQQQIDDSVFNIPSDCQKDCPKTSFCNNIGSGDYKNPISSLKFIEKKEAKNIIREKDQ